jgi:hypothetical protein
LPGQLAAVLLRLLAVLLCLRFHCFGGAFHPQNCGHDLRHLGHKLSKQGFQPVNSFFRGQHRHTSFPLKSGMITV